MEFTQHKPGNVSWVDLATSDTEAAVRFYSDLFGWEHMEITSPDEQKYIFFLKNGKSVAGAYTLTPEQVGMNVPPNWMCYFASADANETTEKVRANGGQVIVEPTTNMEEGNLAVYLDPDGGAFGIWQAKSHIGASYKYEHGSICWCEYGSQGLDKAVPFYEQVFGWNAKKQNMGGMDYTIFNNGDEQAAGAFTMPSEMSDVPANWLTYFEIADIDKALETIMANSCHIIMPKTFFDSVGHVCVFSDPQGAVVGLVQSVQS